MNCSLARLATHVRTWLLIAALTGLLIAALTGLLIAIGGAIGGLAPYGFAALAVCMNLAGYWFSDKLALRASRARPVQAGQLPELRAMLEDLAHRAELPVPRLYVIPSARPNAFATGRNPERAAIAVTEGLLFQLPAREIEGVLAHEFGHIKNRDTLVCSIAAAVFLLAVSRRREYLADATAAELLGRAAPLADALETLEHRAPAVPMSVSPAGASPCAINPPRRQGLATLFKTHPPIAARIRRLRALDGRRVRMPAPRLKSPTVG